MFKKLIALILIAAFTSMGAFALNKEDNNMTRSEIADKNLKTLFDISLKDNKGSDKDMMDILQKYIFGEVFEVGNLDIKTREMLTVVSLTAQQTIPQLKAHINASLNAGVTPVELREAIYQCAPFIGFPKTLNALNVFNEVIKERGLEKSLKSTATVKETERYEKGYAIQNPIYGDEIAENLEGLPEDLGARAVSFLTEVCFGDFYTREGLDLKTRELLIIGLLVTTGNTSVLKSHIKGNLKVGNSIETVTAAIIQVMPYTGFPQAFAALKTVKEVMKEN